MEMSTRATATRLGITTLSLFTGAVKAGVIKPVGRNGSGYLFDSAAVERLRKKIEAQRASGVERIQWRSIAPIRNTRKPARTSSPRRTATRKADKAAYSMPDVSGLLAWIDANPSVQSISVTHENIEIKAEGVKVTVQRLSL